MKLNDFNYELPEELIAYHPLPKRDGSRMMALRRDDGSIEHKYFLDLPDFLRPGDLLVLNDTKVIPAKLVGISGNGKRSEVLLTERVDSRTWKILAKKPKEGQEIVFPQSRVGTIRKLNDKEGIKEWLIEFSDDLDNYDDLDDYIESFGVMPLPPYIKRDSTQQDKESYQTVYAQKPSAIAAPTAGLHFTENVLKEITNLGVEIQFVTLHVGIGTFQPVKSAIIEEHVMHSEIREISKEAANSVNRAKAEGRRVIAVGTTVVRTLESSVDGTGLITPAYGPTNMFIYPGYRFEIVDALLTNYHMPRSTLFMLVCAFAGMELVFNAYAEAITKRYRFLSYGDSMFIL